MRLNVLVFECLQYPKVLILFLFSMKYFYFFMAKITPNMAEITNLWDQDHIGINLGAKRVTY